MWREMVAVNGKPRSQLALVALAAMVLWAGGLPYTPAFAQTRSMVHFDKGRSAATISGTVVGNEYVDYVLGARKGQTMAVSIRVDGTNGDGSINFNVLPPGSDDVAIYNSSMTGEMAGKVQLPANGDYSSASI